MGLELETSLRYRLQKPSNLDCNMERNVDAAEKGRSEEETRVGPKRDDKYKTVTAKGAQSDKKVFFQGGHKKQPRHRD